jgi:hypothetical protein
VAAWYQRYRLPYCEVSVWKANFTPALWKIIGITFIFLTSDPLDAQAWVDKVMIASEIVYEKEKDQRLKKLLEKPVEIQKPKDTD